jgi:hypothetical protein
VREIRAQGLKLGGARSKAFPHHRAAKITPSNKVNNDMQLLNNDLLAQRKQKYFKRLVCVFAFDPANLCVHPFASLTQQPPFDTEPGPMHFPFPITRRVAFFAMQMANSSTSREIFLFKKFFGCNPRFKVDGKIFIWMLELFLVVYWETLPQI